MRAFRASILCSAAAVTALFCGCQSNQYRISGTAEGLENLDTVYIIDNIEADGTFTPRDTLVVTDGRFSAEGETDSTRFCFIFSKSGITEGFFLEPGSISIALKPEPGASRVGGTKCNDEWQRLSDSTMTIGREINRIAEHVYGGTLTAEQEREGMEQIDRLTKRFSALVIRTAEENVQNEFGYFLLTYYPEEVIDNESRLRLIKQLPAQMQQRPAIKEAQAYMAEKARTGEGQVIQDFRQPQLDGTELSLMDEVRKHRITVIDFWASWCGPCRQETPLMIDMYNRLKDSGLGIVGIALDQEHDAWARATAQLNIPWPQMSDLKGWDNTIAREFSINSIPHTIVVDQEGRILKRGLRGKELEEFLTESLKH